MGCPELSRSGHDAMEFEYKFVRIPGSIKTTRIVNSREFKRASRNTDQASNQCNTH